MRDMVIKECERLLVELGDNPEDYNWNMHSNKELLELYAELRIEQEIEDYGDDDNNGNF